MTSPAWAADTAPPTEADPAAPAWAPSAEESTGTTDLRARAGQTAAGQAGPGEPDRAHAAGSGSGRVADPPADSGPAIAAPAPQPPGTPNPEALLAAYRWHLHPETLRELVPDAEELNEIHDQLTTRLGSATDNSSRARLLGQRSTVSRVLGDLGKAFADGKLALAHAQATGAAADIAAAKARLAPVLQWRGEYDKADQLFADADQPGLPGHLRATIHEFAGRSCYEQGRYLEACDHFGVAVRLGPPDDLDLVSRLEVALDAIFVRVVRTGWGPYPRARQAPPPPGPPSGVAAPSPDPASPDSTSPSSTSPDSTSPDSTSPDSASPGSASPRRTTTGPPSAPQRR